MRILGPLEVVSGGSSLTLGGQKQRAVLAILATRANTVVSADELIERLWTESPPATATTTVQVYVSRLRKLIGSDLIATTGGGYVLRIEPDQLDAARFDRLTARGRELRSSDKPSEAAAALGEALSLWRGAALADFAYDPWAQSDIARLEEERLACLEERLEADLACGRDSELVGELEALVAAHPLRERLRGQLMLALYRGGRQADALDAYQRARSTLVDELGIEPRPELQELNRKILTQEVLAAPSPQSEAKRTNPTNLPRPATAFVGRRRDLDTLEPLLRGSEVRLLTLTGPGGSGKSRLALELGLRLLQDFPDGVYLVALAPVSDPELVVPTIAQALEITEAPPEPLRQTLARALADQRVLLLVDNFEHVIDAAPDVSFLVEHAAELTVLATSRVPLRLSPEHRYEVPPLELPDPDDDLDTIAETDAVAFFLDRAGAAQAGFTLSQEVAGPVVEICRRVDGLPLALELAAARLPVLSPRALASRLDDRLRLLVGGARDRPTRQQTLLATIEWSYDLLEDDEKTLFARLAVFAGSFDLEAAEAVCDAELDVLAGLVDKSLVRQGEHGRFFLLETISEYARERLRNQEGRAELQLTHALHYLELAERAEPELRGAGQREWLDRLDEEHADLRLAVSWARDDGRDDIALRMGAALWRFWCARNHVAEGGRVLDSVLERAESGSAELHARAVRAASRLARERGDATRSTELGERALAFARESGSQREVAAATENLGVATFLVGDAGRAGDLLEGAVEQFRAVGDTVGQGNALNNLGNVLIASEQSARARQVLEDALALQREAENSWGVGFALHSLGHLGLSVDDVEFAARHFVECVQLGLELGDSALVAECLGGLARVAARRGEDYHGVVLWAAGSRILTDTGRTTDTLELFGVDEHWLTEARERLSQAAFDRAMGSGAVLAPEEAVRYVVEFVTNGPRNASADAVSSR